MYEYIARLFNQDGVGMWLLIRGNKQIQHFRRETLWNGAPWEDT